MSEMFQFDLVTPEKKISSDNIEYVIIPGSEGDLMALPNHSSCVTSIRPGILTLGRSGNREDYFVSGGFAEISAKGTILLAEQAVLKGDLTTEMLNGGNNGVQLTIPSGPVNLCAGQRFTKTVSYTHLTLPTNREV